METHFNIQRRLYDYQLALTRTPHEFDEAHQRFLALYNTTAHQGPPQGRLCVAHPPARPGGEQGAPGATAGARAQVRPGPLCAHHQSVWVWHLAPLALLRRRRCPADADPAVGGW